MKNRNLFYILFYMLSMFLIIGCERTELQKSFPKDDSKITPRLEDCTDCPVDDCCCYIELANGAQQANLIFCGTTNPEASTQSCGPIDYGNCPEINGYFWLEQLTDSGNPNEFFCMAKGTGFMLGLTSGATNFNITCQYGQGTPQILNFSLTHPNKLFFNVNGDCELEPCHE